MTATGTSFCPGKDINRSQSPLSSSLTASLYCPQLAEPQIETAGNGETLPQCHKGDYKRMGLNSTDNILITSTIFTIGTDSGLFCYPVTVDYWSFKIISCVYAPGVYVDLLGHTMST